MGNDKYFSLCKQRGQLLFALPFLKQLLNIEVENLTKSNSVIDKDFRILLPEFNNLEIQLSHLTKAVYFLFYKNPQGINIKKSFTNTERRYWNCFQILHIN